MDKPWKHLEGYRILRFIDCERLFNDMPVRVKLTVAEMLNPDRLENDEAHIRFGQYLGEFERKLLIKYLQTPEQQLAVIKAREEADG